MYHYVHDREPMTSHGVGGLTPKRFKHQLDRLCAVMTPTDWPSLYAWMQGRGDLPGRCFLLTFDDGLADHARFVLPILQERGLRGVFFVPASILTGQGMLSAHAIHLLLSTLGEERFREELYGYLHDHAGDADWLAALDREAAERTYHYESPSRAHLKYLLTMTLPIDVRQAAITALFERHVGSAARWGESWYLGWEDLVRMESRGHTIGGHGDTHEPQHRLNSEQCYRGTDRVATVLRAGLGADLRPFSYPYGSLSNESVSACREAGFAHAFTTQPDWITRRDDPYRLPRVDTIDVDDVLEKEFACTPT